MFDQLFGLDGRVALVTGASSGLGARFARVLAAAGAQVVVAARRAERLDALVATLPGALAIPCDVTDDAACRDLIDTTVATFGHIDVLVNNAGISAPRPAIDESASDFASIVDVNLVGLYRLAQLAGASMIAADRPGAIINVASIAGLVGIGRMPQASYAASKAGVIGLTRELAAQWARKGVRVNAIAPGFFPTEMTEGLFGTERGEAWVAKLTPVGRGGAVDELDGVLLYLAGAASSYVTGAVIPVDGGWTAV